MMPTRTVARGQELGDRLCPVAKEIGEIASSYLCVAACRCILALVGFDGEVESDDPRPKFAFPRMPICR